MGSDFSGGVMLGALVGGAIALGVTLVIVKIASSGQSTTTNGGATPSPPLDPTYSGTNGIGMLHGHRKVALNRPHRHSWH